ncbi:MAG: hypothetical protein IT406_03450 [Candidatus Yanofskybacteria bacterium]|nr:hypothetical protein [Candidatus Yanofskybacteria bacterium]
MTITSRGVTLNRRRWGAIGLLFLIAVEGILSLFLVLSLAADALFPQGARAAVGVSRKLSYQGRLTDLSGTALGGSSGTNYCFRFRIYDAATGGSQVWPLGGATPASTTVKVKDGIFATAIGDANVLNYDFTANDTLYLQVEVNNTPTTCSGSWETLDVRQRLDAVAYARTAEFVYSDLLRVASGSAAVQIGTGAGQATPIFLGLDVKNTDEAVGASCTTNGRLWYNSSDSRARVCQGGIIQDIVDGLLVRDEGVDQGRASTALDFTGGGVSASRGAGGVINVNIPVGSLSGGTTRATLGEIVFSNANGVSFGVNGQTITASVNAGGGGGGFREYAATNMQSWNSAYWAVGANTTHSTVLVAPLQIRGSVSVKTLGFMLSRSSGTTLAHTLYAGVYSLNGSTLSLISSTSGNFSLSTTAQWAAARMYQLTGLSGLELTPGQYWVAVRAAVTSGSIHLLGRASASGNFSGRVLPGTNSSATNSSVQWFPGQGWFSSGALPNSMALSNINNAGTLGRGAPFITITEI